MNHTILSFLFIPCVFANRECFDLQKNWNENLSGAIIKEYFSETRCVTILKLTEKSPEILYHNYGLQVLTSHVNAADVKSSANLRVRPRRDLHRQNRVCQENSQGFIIVVSVVPELLAYMFSNQITAFCSPQALFFIYFTEERCSANMTGIFKKLWDVFKVPHVAIAGCACQNILFYDPFERTDKEWGSMKSYALKQVATNPRSIRNDMRDLNGYPLTAILFRSPFTVPQKPSGFAGIDVNILALMSAHLNFTSHVVLPHDDDQYGFRLPNGTYTGALRRLLDGDADIINVNYFVKDYLTADIEFGASAMADNLCVILRNAEKIPDWQLLYYCFDHTVWIVVALTYFAVSLFWLALGKMLVSVGSAEQVYPFIFTDTFRIMITSSIFRSPAVHSERVLLTFCLAAFVTLVGAFQGSLYGVYSTPMFYKNVDTLEELSQTDTKIKSEYMFFIDDVFSDASYPVIRRLKSMISFYNDSTKITHRVATQKNFATLVRQSEVEIDNSTTKFYDSNGNNLIHMVRECPRSYSLAYIFPVNSAFAPQLNDVILMGAQAGLYVKWYKEMAFNVTTARKNEPGLSDAFKIFSLKDMQIAFYQLSIGLVISGVVFVSEVVYGTLKRIRK